MYVAFYTGWSGVRVEEVDEDALAEFLEENNEVDWVTPEEFSWEVANNGVLVEGEVITP